MDNISFVAVLLYMFGTWSTATTNSTTIVPTSTAPSTTPSTPTDNDDSSREKLFGNPFWLGFTVILFICLLVLSLVVSLTFGIHKYRQNARKRGLYRDKNRIYNEQEDNNAPDYSIFQAELKEGGVTNAAYVGST